MNRNTFRWLAILAAACALAAPAAAQTVANGPYYATPAWDQTLPAASRFIVLSNYANQAVLDRETGLVWERSPSSDMFFQALPDNVLFGGTYAHEHCMESRVGGRMGWRLPTVAELSSLIDPAQSSPAMPLGHPFVLGNLRQFWTSTRYYPDKFPGAHRIVDVYFGVTGAVNGNTLGQPVWCVRGGTRAGD